MACLTNRQNEILQNPKISKGKAVDLLVKVLYNDERSQTIN
jgi:hypothetical protein